MNQTAKKASGTLRELLDWLDAVVVSVFCIVLLFSFVFRMVGVDGRSMENTLMDQDKVIIRSIAYTPKAGDIVVISRDHDLDGSQAKPEPLIKRIIATEGQTIDIDFTKGAVYVDDVELKEDYIKELTYNPGTNLIDLPATVPPGCVFAMGDNRNISKDSRNAEIGMVDTRYIIGQAVFRIYPFDSFGVVK